ncbi:Helix-turn-helix domain-containing protein [Cohnella sp. OV330]|uniref:response regulator transcription factor n=1 Tax=Cohnella sp. OV330 TaxID=1855288 RepID=UPI0008E757B3|nr:response regulator [Cohnella sp. OV330]SFB49048.1 Helix-turn-helix domain-containing protein [Cohnella sp. OV330]
MYKILIADDEMIVRHAVKSMIRWDDGRFEYVGAAANGRAALELARDGKADIVITDIKMPELDGIGLIKALASGGFDGEVLVLSNYNDFDLVREALKCGAHDYMLKLTLKSESFMEALGEIAAKLDARRGAAGEAADGTSDAEGGALAGTQAGADRERAGRERAARIKGWLAAMDAEARRDAGGDAGGEGLPGSADAAVSREIWQDKGERVLAFLVRLRDEEPARPEGDSFADKLGDLADSLFPGRRWAHAVKADDGCFVLAAGYSAAQAVPEAGDAARRIQSLCAMYYNAQTQVVFAEPASDAEALLEQMRGNRRAAQLLFYAQLSAAGLSNRTLPAEEDDEYRRAEASLRESVRGKPQAGSTDLWVEGALRLIETAAERRIAARVLKRSLGGSVLGLANAQGFGIRRDWDEAPWLARVSAAATDTQLKEAVRELAEDAAEQADAKRDAYPAAREEVRQALRYLEYRYAERLAIADVAAHVGLSEPYLCHVFKAETGRSLLTHLNEIRMQKAYALLETGRYLVKQAAAEVGIHDPFYFNRLFKKRFGIAPKNVKPAD